MKHILSIDSSSSSNSNRVLDLQYICIIFLSEFAAAYALWDNDNNKYCTVCTVYVIILY
jgi:hypothetical protein